MDLRMASALVASAVRAASQSRAPRRTLAAVAASSIAAVHRCCRDVAPASTGKMQNEAGDPAASHTTPGAAGGAKAAARQRQRAAKRARNQQQKQDHNGSSTAQPMPVDDAGQSGAVVPMDTEVIADVVPPERAAQHEVAKEPLGSAVSSSQVPAGSMDEEGVSKLPYKIGDECSMGRGSKYEATYGRVSKMSKDTATLVIPRCMMYHDQSPLEVRHEDLKLMPSTRPHGAGRGRGAHPSGRKQRGRNN